jgi:hypothetical protein
MVICAEGIVGIYDYQRDATKAMAAQITWDIDNIGEASAYSIITLTKNKNYMMDTGPVELTIKTRLQ